jgi:hypothetical protein
MVDSLDDLPPNVLALILKFVAIADHASATSLESTCKRVNFASASYLVWLDVARIFGVDDCESAQCLSSACHAISLAESDIAALPVGGDSMFDAADASPVHVNCARFVAPFDRTVRVALQQIYERIGGAAAICARRNAVCRELVMHWRPMFLSTPERDGSLPAIEGFYTALYGWHGVELVWIERQGWRIRGIKLTGDPNVPAGEVSIDLLLARDLGRALGRVRLAERGFRAPHWGVAFASHIARTIDLEWAERDQFAFTPCTALDALVRWTVIDLARWDQQHSLHRLQFERLPQRVRDEFQRLQQQQR